MPNSPKRAWPKNPRPSTLITTIVNTITTTTTSIFMTLITGMIATDTGSHHADSEL